MGPIFRTQSPDEALGARAAEQARQSEARAGAVQLVGDVAHPYGMGVAKIENVAIVTGLSGTGEDPPPSAQRAAMLAEMNRRGVENPNEVLASPNTALVVVRAFLHPGMQEGEKFDVEIKTPARSETASLAGGWLLETRLSETAVLGGQIRRGHEAGIAQGAVLVDFEDNGRDNRLTRGRILGGGVCTKSRSLGLVLDHDRQSIRTSQLVGKAINNRFHAYVDGHKMGVATPKTDEFIEIKTHPRYKENLSRYMRVLRSVALTESSSRRVERMKLLREQLLDPITAETAALRLEAIGDAEAVDVLKEGIAASDREVRFYASEALAYLDVTDGVKPLAEAARDEPAFRISALAALGSMADGAAAEALAGLLAARSAETRYGAFRSLTLLDPNDPAVKGESLGGRFHYHRLSVGGTPMIHVTASHHAEVVLFGRDHPLQTPLMLDAGEKIKVNGLSGEELTVVRYAANEPTQERRVKADVDAVIRAIVDLGGEYPDVVQMLQQAKRAGALESRFKVDALPTTGRELRDESDREESPSLAAKD